MTPNARNQSRHQATSMSDLLPDPLPTRGRRAASAPEDPRPSRRRAISTPGEPQNIPLRDITPLMWRAATTLVQFGFSRRQVAIILYVSYDALNKRFQRAREDQKTPPLPVRQGQDEVVVNEDESNQDEEDYHNSSNSAAFNRTLVAMSYEFENEPEHLDSNPTRLDPKSKRLYPRTKRLDRKLPCIKSNRLDPTLLVLERGREREPELEPTPFEHDTLAYDSRAVYESLPTDFEEVWASDLLGRDSHQETLFFPDRAMPCMEFQYHARCSSRHCNFLHHESSSLKKFLGYINRASTSIDICIYVMTLLEITDVILRARSRGVQVRVLTDRTEESRHKYSQIHWLRAAGIPVDHTREIMHMKFCVVDGLYLLAGSFNYSFSGVMANHEHVAIHKGGKITQDFRDYFKSLWAQGEARLQMQQFAADMAAQFVTAQSRR